MKQEPIILSIITVVRNGAATLEKTIASVAQYRCPGVEYVVVDGGSTDGTQELLKRHADTIDSWQSGPDAGIYDAMNKGVQRAQGERLLFLGCDDELATPLAELLPRLADDSTIYYGNTYWPHAGRIHDGPFSAAKLARTNICHQAVLYPRAALLKHPFNLRYRYQADWEVNMRCFSDPAWRLEYIPVTIAIYNDASGESTINRDLNLEADYPALLWHHFPPAIALWRSAIAIGGRLLRKLGWQGLPASVKK